MTHNEKLSYLYASEFAKLEMKNIDMLYWFGTMNAIKNQAEEIILNELIYV